MLRVCLAVLYKDVFVVLRLLFVAVWSRGRIRFITTRMKEKFC